MKNSDKGAEGIYLKDAVYGASDGIVTTFAVVAGVSGAALNPNIVLILGFANLVADGFSMAAGNYVGTRSEQEYNQSVKRIIAEDINSRSAEMKQELTKIYMSKGFDGKLLKELTDKTAKDPELWANTLLTEKYSIESWNESAIKSSIATFSAFVIAGFMPLVAYVFASGIVLFASHTFEVSIILTGLTLVAVGALKSNFTKRSVWKESAQMLFVGGAAAALAYYVGFLISTLI